MFYNFVSNPKKLKNGTLFQRDNFVNNNVVAVVLSCECFKGIGLLRVEL